MARGKRSTGLLNNMYAISGRKIKNKLQNTDDQEVYLQSSTVLKVRFIFIYQVS